MRKETHERFRKFMSDADLQLSYLSDRVKGFKYRVEVARQWWNEHLLEENKEGFLLGSKLKVNDVECLCTHVDISVSGYVCKFVVRPLSALEDVGAGLGRTRTIEF